MAKSKLTFARRCSVRDVKMRWIAPVACVNAPDVEVSKRAWCIARDRLTDLLSVVSKTIFSSECVASWTWADDGVAKMA